MPHPRLLLASLGLTVLTLGAGPALAQSAPPSLYHRLGGYDKIAAFVDDFIERFDADPALAPFLGGLNAAAGARVRQRIVDLVCARTGGPCLYTGQTMEATHEGLPITDAHFDAVIRHMRAAMDHQGMPASARDQLLEILTAMRPAMVAK
ncbi:MAG: group 1 truncated hemoglobin [Gemmatimonadales bacterium]